MNTDTLLELVAPHGDEELAGAVLTTFELDSRFLEEELLTTLVGLPVGSGELARARSELHERLLAAEGRVAVHCDARCFDGGRFVGAYDLRLVPAPPTFHPKVLLSVWRERTGRLSARAIVASANLTRAGYRRNAEVVVAADSAESADHRLISDVVGFLRTVSSGHSSSVEVLDIADGLLRPRSTGRRRLMSSRNESMIDLLFDELAPSEHVRAGVVVSPYFERGTDTAAESVLSTWCERLKQRAGLDFQGARFYVPERLVEGRLVVELQLSRAVAVLGADLVEAYTLSGLAHIDPERADPVPRPVHGKLLVIETDRRCLVLAGSANFTNAALLNAGSKANWEASVLLTLPPGSSARLLPSRATLRDLSQLTFTAPKSEPPLPPLLFADARYEVARHELTLTPRNAARSSSRWELRVDGDQIASGVTGDVLPVRVVLRRHPAEFSVAQHTAAGVRHIPIEIVDKANLPLPGAGGQPGGDDVLDYFAGLRTAGEFDAGDPGANATDSDRDELPALEHLSRFSRALYGIADHLERPARSVLEYRARWSGAWGVMRVLNLLHDRFGRHADDPAYALFETWELRHTLASVNLVGDDRCPEDVKSELRAHALGEVDRLLGQVEAAVPDTEAVAAIRRRYEGQE